jgi:hypothetical protein
MAEDRMNNNQFERGIKMNKQLSLTAGIILILVGILALVFTLALPMLGLHVWLWGVWQLWPLAVASASALFVLPPLFVRGRRALGALFIPGMPLLTTGAILLFANVFNLWGAWQWLWPLEVLALAQGFLLAAVYTRVIWLIVPATIIGANGLVLQFCALTGLWEAWAVLWPVEPLSVGLSLLVISAKRRRFGLFVAGLIICGLAGLGLVGMTTILSKWWPISLLGSGVLILAGILLLLWKVIGRLPLPRLATE